MYNFRMALDSTCTSAKIIDKLSKTWMLPGVKYPRYSDIIEALSNEGYFCYAEPVETFATTSRMAWCPVLVYRRKGGTELTKLFFPKGYLSIQYTDAMDDVIDWALDIILDKNPQPEYGKD